MDAKDIFVKSLLVGIYDRSDESSDAFYAALLNSIPVENTTKVPTAAATFEMDKGTFKVVANVEALLKLIDASDERKIKFLRGVIKHELMHIFLGHLFLKDFTIDTQTFKHKLSRQLDLPERIEFKFTRKSAMLINLAADAIINSQLTELNELAQEGLIKLAAAEDFLVGEMPEGTVFCAGTRLFKNAPTVEELAAVLYVLAQQLGLAPEIDDGDVDSGGSKIKSDTLGRDFEQIEGEVTVAKEQWANAVETALEKARGTEQIITELRKYLESRKRRITWNKRLRAELMEEFSEKLRIEKHRFSKRTQLPPKLGRAFAPSVVAFVDTSASVSDQELNMFIQELANLRNQSEAQITVVCYSTGANVQKIRRKSDTIEIKERGGTDLAKALDAVQLKQVDLVVVFTDGFDEFPEQQIRKIRGRKVFVLTSNHSHDFREKAAKHGEVIVLDS